MIKTKTTETTEKYDKDGKLVERVIREETSEDDETRSYITPTNPWTIPTPIPCLERNNFKITW